MGPKEGRGWGRRQEQEERQMPLGFHAIALVPPIRGVQAVARHVILDSLEGFRHGRA